MVEWASFFEGFATDSVVLTVVMVLLGPKILEWWIRNNLADTILDFMDSPAFKEIRARLEKEIKGSLFGGRPTSIKGALKEGAAQLVRHGIGWGLQKLFSGAQAGETVVGEAADTTARILQ